MMALVLLFSDFLSFALFSEWVLYASLCYLLALGVVPRETSRIRLGIALGAYLLQNFAMHGRFGLGLVVVLPIMLLAYRLRFSLMNGSYLLLAASIAGYFVAENALLYAVVLASPLPMLVTIIKIFINLAVGYVILWGMLGNRSLVAAKVSKGRKVWTPSRKDASQGL